MVEGARLESEYTAKPYRGFESLPLRHNNIRRFEFKKASIVRGMVRSIFSHGRRADVALPLGIKAGKNKELHSAHRIAVGPGWGSHY